MAGSLTLWSEAAKNRYALAQVPGLADALSVTERRVFKASFGRPFNSFATPQELALALAEPVKFAMMDVGVKGGDNEEQAYRLARISEILKRYYGILTIEDFRQAFELLVVGELDKFLPKREGLPDRNHYGAFNVEYVSKVLNAYVRQRDIVMSTAEKLRPKEEVRDREAERGVRKALWMDFLSYKYRGVMPPMGTATVVVYYKIFARLGWVDASLAELSQEEQEAVLMSAVLSIGGKGAKEDRRTAWKRREIERAFRDLAEDEVQLNKFLRI